MVSRHCVVEWVARVGRCPFPGTAPLPWRLVVSGVGLQALCPGVGGMCGGGSAVSRHSALAVVACGERRWFPGLCCFQALRRWTGGLWGTVSISRHCAFAMVAVVSGIGFQALRPCVGGLWGNSAVSRHCAAGAERCWFPGIASLNGWHVWDGVHFQVSRCPGLGRCLFVTSHVYGSSWRIFAEYVPVCSVRLESRCAMA